MEIIVTITLVYKHKNASMWALSICISRYPTIIEESYNINTYNVGIYKIGIL